MSTRPSNDAIAQAFWETDLLFLSDEFFSEVKARAREIDAAKPLEVMESKASKTLQSGWVMVPRVSTEAMVDAGNEGAAPYMVNARDLWTQMLEAAPAPPKAEAVAWQSRHKDSDGRWLGWGQHPSEQEAKALCDRYRELGFEAEYRSLYTAQLSPSDDVVREQQRGENDDG